MAPRRWGPPQAPLHRLQDAIIERMTERDDGAGLLTWTESGGGPATDAGFTPRELRPIDARARLPARMPLTAS